MTRFLSAILLFLIAGLGPARAEPLTVFAASSLSDVLTEIGAAFEEETATHVRFSFAASSTIARQIEAGAPADVVSLASREWADYLSDRGLIGAKRVSGAFNRLVLIAPAGTQVADPLSTGGIAQLLGEDGRIALGDPAHVPAGIYAREALQNLGLWDIVGPRIAQSDNVRAALALVERGEAAAGIVYATDARIANVAVLAEFPEDAHHLIEYPFAVVTHGQISRIAGAFSENDAARSFLHFVAGDAARAIFVKHGFGVK